MSTPFEHALGRTLHDPYALYEAERAAWVDAAQGSLRIRR